MPRIYYKGSNGDIIEFDNRRYYLNRDTNILSYEWKYTNSEYVNRIESFDMKFVKKQMNIGILALSDADFEAACRQINNVFDYDVRTLSPGKLYVGNQYVSCYFVASGLSRIDTSNRKRKNVVLKPYTMICEDGQWLEEINFDFAPEIDDNQLHDRTYKGLQINSADAPQKSTTEVSIKNTDEKEKRIFSGSKLARISGENIGTISGSTTKIGINQNEYEYFEKLKSKNYEDCKKSIAFLASGKIDTQKVESSKQTIGVLEDQYAISTPIFRLKSGTSKIKWGSKVVTASSQEDLEHPVPPYEYDYIEPEASGATIECYDQNMKLIYCNTVLSASAYHWDEEQMITGCDATTDGLIGVYPIYYMRLSVSMKNFWTDKPNALQEFFDNFYIDITQSGNEEPGFSLVINGGQLGANDFIQKESDGWYVYRNKVKGNKATNSDAFEVYLENMECSPIPWLISENNNTQNAEFTINRDVYIGGTRISAVKNGKIIGGKNITEKDTFPLVYAADCDEFVIDGNIEAEEIPYLSDTSLDHIYDFKHDYFSSMISNVIINDTVEKADFVINIHGPASQPSVIIAGNTYSVDAELEEGDTLIIDSVNKTVKKRRINGKEENLFNKRGRASYIFEKIPIGKSTVIRNGIYAMEIDIIKYRSEPEWWI